MKARWCLQSVLERDNLKTYCKDVLLDHELVIKAYELWLTSESGKKNGWRVIDEYGDIYALSEEIVHEIETFNLNFRPIRYHNEIERNGKMRRIGVESVKQQIVNYTINLILDDFYNDKIGFYQIASIKEKGPIFGAKTVQKWISEEKLAYVHGDVTKCYESISKQVVMSIAKKYIRNRYIVYTISRLMDTYEKGLGIGSAFSLKMAQVVLSFVYHMIEDLHKVRRGCRRNLVRHQIWYADDFYIFSYSKTYLVQAMKQIENYMYYNLGLSIKRWKICWSDEEPIDIAGYVVFNNRITIRSKTFLRIKRIYKSYDNNPNIELARSVCSYWGILKYSSSKKTIKKNEFDRIFRNARYFVSNYDRNNK